MLYRHLQTHGHEPQGTAKPTGQHGPDFRIEHAGRTIWIEAVVPGPQEIPAEYLEPPVLGGKIRSKTKPNDERVLRCTSTITDKQLKFDEYRAKGIIGAGDCTVIAVNICRLSDLDPDGKDTRPELSIRRQLHKLGFRYRLHAKKLPGKPDLVLPKYNAVIFIHGCFWHCHECSLFRYPASRPEFWRETFAENMENDRSTIQKLKVMGWRIAVIWECIIRGRQSITPSRVAARISRWLMSGKNFAGVESEDIAATPAFT